MIRDYIQNIEDEKVLHKDCEYIVYDVQELGNEEVLAKCKVKNQKGEFVGLIPFSFYMEGDESSQIQAEAALVGIINKA